ncbi:GatB/GatE catalytic domain-containing protein [Lipomyces japonicus]|uniref:GatB/GatE catalytic domain-containing protein n=1 Tax=Lipomyces japonicus TaxID=56871 RepID=UPI0034CEFA74
MTASSRLIRHIERPRILRPRQVYDRKWYHPRYSDQQQWPGLKCGLEIHLQLKTNRKLFSPSKTSFHASPNTHVSLFDAAIPGTQPILNTRAVLLALRAALALECHINLRSSFDRKHYFYADQPAGYQITQHYHALANNGHLMLTARDGDIHEDVSIGIEQIQLEQDTGKSTYPPDSTISYIDLNRTNHPLIEIVSKPDITTPAMASVFVKKLQALLKHLEVSTCEFQSSAIRVDVNVSYGGGARCEIKNLASTDNVVRAIAAEYARQKKAAEKGEPVSSFTLGWDGKQTVMQRPKENASEYRYLPDPELPHVVLSKDLITQAKATMPMFPDQIITLFTGKPHNLSLKNARTLVSRGLVDYYRKAFNLVEAANLPGKLAANILVNDILGITQTDDDVETLKSKVTPQALAELITSMQEKKITKNVSLTLVRHYVENPEDDRPIAQVIDEYKLEAIDDKSLIHEACQVVLRDNEQIVSSIVSGRKPQAIHFLVAQVLRQGQGRFSPADTRAVMSELFKQKFPHVDLVA